jgi:hypothetical protein
VCDGIFDYKKGKMKIFDEKNEVLTKKWKFSDEKNENFRRKIKSL